MNTRQQLKSNMEEIGKVKTLIQILQQESQSKDTEINNFKMTVANQGKEIKTLKDDLRKCKDTCNTWKEYCEKAKENTVNVEN